MPPHLNLNITYDIIILDVTQNDNGEKVEEETAVVPIRSIRGGAKIVVDVESDQPTIIAADKLAAPAVDEVSNYFILICL